MSRNVELEGPSKFSNDTEGREIYTVWYDCDCGRRLPLLASPSPLGKLDSLNVWHLEVKGDRLSTTPSILNTHGERQCHFYITDEPFKLVDPKSEGPSAGLKAKE